MKKFLFLPLVLCMSAGILLSQTSKRSVTLTPSLAIMAYYTGNGTEINQYHIDELTHLIFSFLHLRGTQLAVDSSTDSVTLRQLSALKNQYPHLKVMVSMGGWGGCAPCSAAFSTPQGRYQFAQSVKQILQTYQLDGIDLDWEYPAIQGYPGHLFTPQDKENFTNLIRCLRHELGKKKTISFAAGGFDEYLRHSIDWRKVVPLVNYVNLMSYDLVNGYSKVTGLHTPLYSSAKQPESVDNAIHYFDSIKINMHKIVIGAAFYARVWTDVPDTNHGLFESGIFTDMVNYKNFDSYFTPANGFVSYWDNDSQAPYYYSQEKHAFGTFDDVHSVQLKTDYVKERGLGGIMFWELTCDKAKDGLLEAIYQRTKNASSTVKSKH
jgi:chitinase